MIEFVIILAAFYGSNYKLLYVKAEIFTSNNYNKVMISLNDTHIQHTELKVDTFTTNASQSKSVSLIIPNNLSQSDSEQL